MLDTSVYWSPDRILSYNRLFNFVIGNRGAGKTYGMKKLAIKRFLKKGEQFAYIRRYGNEFGRLTKFFADVGKEFPDHEFDARGNTMGGIGEYIIDGKTAGFAIPLSVSAKFKSNPFPDVTLMIFDEFIIERGRITYIKDEVTLFLDLYETVIRSRDEPAFFLSNAITLYNPYFTYFNIKPQPGTRFLRGEEICCEFVNNEEYKEAKRNTRFGRLISGTRYGDYAIENKFFLDNNQFIEPMSGVCFPWCKILYGGQDYYVWYGQETGYIYFNRKTAPNSVNSYCIFTEDHTPNMMLIKRLGSSKMFQSIRTAYETGQMRFDSIQSKSVFYEFMQYI